MDPSPPDMEHRHRRLALWARLWLARIVRCMAAVADLPLPKLWRNGFDRALELLTKLVLCLVVIRAAQLRPAPRLERNPRQIALAMKRHDVRVQERGGMRAAIGARLRRAVRVGGFQPKDFRTRAEKLLRVLNALEDFAARVAYRARNGLTRLLQIHSGVGAPLPSCRAKARSAQAGLHLHVLGTKLRVIVAPP